MNLIFLYGPPAVGKLTFAKELEKRLGYKLLYNHMIINLLENLFPFYNPSRRKLTRAIRLMILKEVAINNFDIIITAGTAGSKTLFDYFTELIDFIEKRNGHVHMVHLTADPDTLMERVEDEFRKKHGKNFGKKEMQDMLSRYAILFDKYPHREHLTINTKELQPD